MNLGTYFVFGSANIGSNGLIDVVRVVKNAGIDVVQLREKDVHGNVLDSREFYKNAVIIADELKGSDTLFIINDRIDVAIALYINGYKVNGVHIGQADLNPSIVRCIVNRIGWNDAMIGLSCRTEEALAKATKYHKTGVIDYVGMGPVHTTNSKPNMPQGMEYDRWGELRAIVKNSDPQLPVVAIGGITPVDAKPLQDVGADGYCCISYIAGAENVYDAAQEFVNAWKGNVDEN